MKSRWAWGGFSAIGPWVKTKAPKAWSTCNPRTQNLRPMRAAGVDTQPLAKSHGPTGSTPVIPHPGSPDLIDDPADESTATTIRKLQALHVRFRDRCRPDVKQPAIRGILRSDRFKPGGHMRSDISEGGTFPDYELADQSGKRRSLSELQGGNPMVLHLSRGGSIRRSTSSFGNWSTSIPSFETHTHDWSSSPPTIS